jgi:hypothetical protein
MGIGTVALVSLTRPGSSAFRITMRQTHLGGDKLLSIMQVAPFRQSLTDIKSDPCLM